MILKLLKLSVFFKRISIFFGKVGSWLAMPLIFVIIFDVITRRFFILGSTKLQEMEWHLHTALFLLTLGYAYISNAHVRIEILRDKYSNKLKAILEIIGILVFLIPYCALIIYFGLDFVKRSFSMNEVSSALTGLSHRWIIKSFIPLGAFFLFCAAFSILLKKIIFLITLNSDFVLKKKILEYYPDLEEEFSQK